MATSRRICGFFLALAVACPLAAQNSKDKPKQADDQKDVFVLGGTPDTTPKPTASNPDTPPIAGPTPQSLGLSNKPLREENRMALIRGLEAEFVFLRRTFPMGEKTLALKNGVLSPDDATIRQLVATKGTAGKPGDRAQITAIQFRGSSLYLELNGGPKKKTKWYQHIQVSMGGGGGTAVSPTADDNVMAKGSALTLQFDKYVPDITVDQVKQLLAPVFDFSSKSATQSFAETLPPKVRDAIKNHQVLVGMNRELAMDAKGRPDQKIRDTEDGKPYEEWVYGAPPQQVVFVRFHGDEVTQVKIMTVDGQKLVRTEKEMDMKDLHASSAETDVAAKAAAPLSGSSADGTKTAGDQQDASKAPPKKPTLRRPGEDAPSTQPSAPVPVNNPTNPDDSDPTYTPFPKGPQRQPTQQPQAPPPAMPPPDQLPPR